MFVKYDFENLFPSLRLEPVCLMFSRFLLENLPDSQHSALLLRDIVHTICYDSYFTFKGAFYQQLKGVPIGSPIAGVLAELTLRNLESDIVHSLQPSLKLYIRYVDDVLTQWTEGADVDKLAKSYNMETYGLVLKKEQQDKNEISYLDIQLVIERSEVITTVYRKPAYETVIIPSWSKDPMVYKKAAFRFFFRRAIMYCSNQEDRVKEVNYIVKIGKDHGYKKQFILSIYREVNQRISNKKRENEEITNT